MNCLKSSARHLETPLYDTHQSNGSDIFRRLYLTQKSATLQSTPIGTISILYYSFYSFIIVIIYTFFYIKYYYLYENLCKIIKIEYYFM